MWDVIWRWKFPSEEDISKRSKKENTKNNNSSLINIDDFIERKSSDINIEQDIQDFWEEIIRIIDNIIDKWIDRYKSRVNSNKPYTEETIKIWEEMYYKSRWIEDWFDYINSDPDWDIEIHWDYILEAIENILSPYSSVVYEYLLKNNEANK